MLRELGLLQVVARRERCMGYANGCACSNCLNQANHIRERGFDAEGMVKPPAQPRQPWDLQQAA